MQADSYSGHGGNQGVVREEVEMKGRKGGVFWFLFLSNRGEWLGRTEGESRVQRDPAVRSAWRGPDVGYYMDSNWERSEERKRGNGWCVCEGETKFRFDLTCPSTRGRVSAAVFGLSAHPVVKASLGRSIVYSHDILCGL